MAMIKTSSSFDYNSRRLHLVIDGLFEDIEDGFFEEVRSSIKNSISTPEIKQRILDEVTKQLLSMESKSELAKIIAEIVSETIKETITQMKTEGLL